MEVLKIQKRRTSMQAKKLLFAFLCSGFSLILSSCATQSSYQEDYTPLSSYSASPPIVQPSCDYRDRLPCQLNTHEKVILVDPNVHAWGAYDSTGVLLKAGIATAGSDYCPDLHRSAHTHPGVFRINSLGNANCKSHIFPLGKGGAPMPYCMFFNKGQALHGSDELAEDNLSHGCVRLRTEDAEWLRYNFADVGTKVIVKAY